jgi:hypothetical protein
MAIDERAIIAEVLRGYALDPGGIHGVAHWAGPARTFMTTW